MGYHDGQTVNLCLHDFEIWPLSFFPQPTPINLTMTHPLPLLNQPWHPNQREFGPAHAASIPRHTHEWSGTPSVPRSHRRRLQQAIHPTRRMKAGSHPPHRHRSQGRSSKPKGVGPSNSPNPSTTPWTTAPPQKFLNSLHHSRRNPNLLGMRAKTAPFPTNPRLRRFLLQYWGRRSRVWPTKWPVVLRTCLPKPGVVAKPQPKPETKKNVLSGSWPPPLHHRTLCG